MKESSGGSNTCFTFFSCLCSSSFHQHHCRHVMVKNKRKEKNCFQRTNSENCRSEKETERAALNVERWTFQCFSTARRASSRKVSSVTKIHLPREQSRSSFLSHSYWTPSAMSWNCCCSFVNSLCFFKFFIYYYKFVLVSSKVTCSASRVVQN